MAVTKGTVQIVLKLEGDGGKAAASVDALGKRVDALANKAKKATTDVAAIGERARKGFGALQSAMAGFGVGLGISEAVGAIKGYAEQQKQLAQSTLLQIKVFRL